MARYCTPTWVNGSGSTFREGLRAPRFVSNREGFQWLDRKLSERLDFYGSYIFGHKDFDRQNTDAVRSPSTRETRLGSETLRYEDVLARPSESLRGLAGFLGAEVDEGWVQSCAAEVRAPRSRWQALPLR